MVAVFMVSAMDAYRREREAFAVLSSVRISNNIVTAREVLRVNTGSLDTALADPEPATSSALDQLRQTHRRAMAALLRVQDGIDSVPEERVPGALKRQTAREITRLDQNLFPDLLKAVQQPIALRPKGILMERKRITNGILSLIEQEGALLTSHIASFGPYLSEMMRINDIAWHARIDAGNQRGDIAVAISRGGKLSAEHHDSLLVQQGTVYAPWQSIKRAMPGSPLPAALTGAIANAERLYFHDYALLRDRLIAELTSGGAPSISRTQWMAASNPALASLMQVSKAALGAAGVKANDNLIKARNDLKASLALMGLSIALAALAMAIVLIRVIRPLKAITRAISSKSDVDTVAELSGRGDEIGKFAHALEKFRKEEKKRRKLERDLLQNMMAKEAAETSSRVKSEFLASMSHELRTPLNAILGFSEILATQLYGPLGNKKYVEYAEDVHKSGAHLLELINDVLDLSKIDAGKMELRETVFPVSELVDDAVLLVGGKAKDHVRLEVCVPGGIQVLADKRLTKQILINLLSNAIKFTPKGGTITVGAESAARDWKSMSPIPASAWTPRSWKKPFLPMAKSIPRSRKSIKAPGLACLSPDPWPGCMAGMSSRKAHQAMARA